MTSQLEYIPGPGVVYCLYGRYTSMRTFGGHSLTADRIMLFKRTYHNIAALAVRVKKEPCLSAVQNASYGHGPSSYLGASGYTWCRSKAAV